MRRFGRCQVGGSLPSSASTEEERASDALGRAERWWMKGARRRWIGAIGRQETVQQRPWDGCQLAAICSTSLSRVRKQSHNPFQILHDKSLSPKLHLVEGLEKFKLTRYALPNTSGTCRKNYTREQAGAAEGSSSQAPANHWREIGRRRDQRGSRQL